MGAKTALTDLLSSGQVLAPCVFDNISVRAVELAQYPAAVLSGGALAYSLCGYPDAGLLNAEELIWITNRMTDYSPLPIIVDADNGYGESPLNAYVTVSRLVKSGANAVVIDDSGSVRGFDRQFAEGGMQQTLISREAFYAKVAAARKACENSDCIVIARSEALSDPSLGLDEAVARCCEARRHGATVTAISGLKTLEQAKRVHAADPGWKMWPSLGAANGRSDVEPEDILPLNFRLVSMHYTEKGAFFGMLYYGKRTLEDGNTVFHDTHDFDGLLTPGQDYHELFSFWKKWLPMEDGFNDLSDVMAKSYEIKE